MSEMTLSELAAAGAAVVVVVAAQSHGMTTFLEAFRRAEVETPEAWRMRHQYNHGSERDSHILDLRGDDTHDRFNRQYSRPDELRDLIQLDSNRKWRNGGWGPSPGVPHWTKRLLMHSVAYADNEGACNLRPALFSVFGPPREGRRPGFPLKAIRAGFLPREVGGDVWKAAVAVPDSYIVAPLETVWDHIELFPTGAIYVDAPEWSYAIFHGEEVSWLKL